MRAFVSKRLGTQMRSERCSVQGRRCSLDACACMDYEKTLLGSCHSRMHSHALTRTRPLHQKLHSPAFAGRGRSTEACHSP
eukprot:1009559-Pleurochrysis_carterae.AAC.1